MDIDNVIKKREEQVSKGVDYLKIRTIGQHVMDLIQHEGKLSVQSLVAALEQSKNTAKTETDRMLAEAALVCLQDSQSVPEKDR